MTLRHATRVKLGSKAAVSLFVASLLAFVAESQLTEVCQYTLVILFARSYILKVCSERFGLPTAILHTVRYHPSEGFPYLTTRMSRDTTYSSTQIYCPLFFRSDVPAAFILPCSVFELHRFTVGRVNSCAEKTPALSGRRGAY